MLSILQARYQRVEKALDTLLESITAYNPSVAAAGELAAADDAVNDALQELAAHHSIYGRILSLRATSAALDAQITSTLRSLVEARSTLKSIDLPRPSGAASRDDKMAVGSLTYSGSGSGARDTQAPHRGVKVDELLAYAKFISKTTVPPTRRGEAPPQGAVTSQTVAQDGNEDTGQQPPAVTVKIEPGSTPEATTASFSGSGAQTGDGQQSQSQTQTQTQTNVSTRPGSADDAAEKNQESRAGEVEAPTTTRTETMKRALPPEIKGQFVPWPSLELIKGGGLAAVQGMVERGVDPASVVLDAGTETETPAVVAGESLSGVGRGQGEGPLGAPVPVQGGATAPPPPPRPREEDEFDPDEM